MALTDKREYTVNDIYALPEKNRAELIDGEIFMMAPPSREHQRIVSFLVREIGNYMKAREGEDEVYPAPFAVFLDADDYTYVEPDISVICDKNKLSDKGCNGAPDWIIEIVEPSSRRMDYYTKLAKYYNAGVREYWIVDSVEKMIIVYYMEEDAAPIMYHFGEKVKVNIYDGFEIDFRELEEDK